LGVSLIKKSAAIFYLDDMIAEKPNRLALIISKRATLLAPSSTL
jgi:hypothetical protein